MERVGRRSMSAAEKAEVWRRWKHGESVSDIGRALGRLRKSVHRVVAAADFWVASPDLSGRSSASRVARDDLSEPLCPDARRAAEGAAHPPAAVSTHAPLRAGKPRWTATGPHHRCGLDSRAPGRGGGPCRARSLGGRPGVGRPELTHRDTGRAAVPLRAAAVPITIPICVAAAVSEMVGEAERPGSLASG